MDSGRGLPDEPRAVQHSILLLHALLGGLQQANHILRLLVVHLTPRGTLLERGGGGGGGRKGEERRKRREGGRGGEKEEGGREGEEGGGGIHVKGVHGITCSKHTSHNQYMYMSVMH